MRARNIKPGFFANEYLAELDPHARLLFIGLWTLADRCGRLEDRPKRIKAEVFPYEEVDVGSLLDALANSQEHFIERYSVGGEQYIQISNFSKHQNPHKKEAPSTIPAPDCSNENLLQSMGEHCTSTIPAPYEHSAGSGISTTKDGASPADSGFRIPDSPLLIPDSGKPVAAYCNDQGIPLTPTHCQEIIGFYEDGVTDDMMRFAVDEAVGANARNWKYAKAIITRWVTDEVKTLDEAKRAQEDFKARRHANKDQPARQYTRMEDYTE